VGDTNRGEYITASSERKRVLASIIFLLLALFIELRSNSFSANAETRIDEIFCFE
jgi:hypothetical protein